MTPFGIAWDDQPAIVWVSLWLLGPRRSPRGAQSRPKYRFLPIWVVFGIFQNDQMLILRKIQNFTKQIT